MQPPAQHRFTEDHPYLQCKTILSISIHLADQSLALQITSALFPDFFCSIELYFNHILQEKFLKESSCEPFFMGLFALSNVRTYLARSDLLVWRLTSLAFPGNSCSAESLKVSLAEV